MPCRASLKNNFLAVLALSKITRREQIYSRDFQFCGRHRTGIGRRFCHQCLGKNARHFIKRCHEAIDHAAMFGTFTERKNIGVRCPHLIIDNNPALDLKPALLAQSRIGTNADSHHDDVGRNNGSICQLNRLRRGSNQELLSYWPR